MILRPSKKLMIFRVMKSLLITLLFAFASSALAQSVYTPKPGSSERQAICDAMREFMKEHVAEKPLPKPIVFKIDTIRVQGDYCFFEGMPVFKDGSDAIPEYLPDIGYTHCLKREKGKWKVFLDLSRTDVPSDGEVREIRRSLPADFPSSVLSDFWRNLFKKVK
jgi:hypothetical protein